jgi:hypothetical protein
MSLKEIFIKNKCDKATKHRYYELYEKDFSEFKNQDIKILEIGTFKGESTQSWIDYFDKAQIYTADTFERVTPDKISALKNNRVQWFKVDSTSLNCKENFNNLGIQFDFIIDDGLHTPEGQRLTFENLIDFLKPTGSYYIEDVWMLNKGNNMSHWWVKKHSKEFTMEKFNKLIDSISKFKVTEHDFSSSKIPDSSILKIKK